MGLFWKEKKLCFITEEIRSVIRIISVKIGLLFQKISFRTEFPGSNCSLRLFLTSGKCGFQVANLLLATVNFEPCTMVSANFLKDTISVTSVCFPKCQTSSKNGIFSSKNKFFPLRVTPFWMGYINRTSRKVLLCANMAEKTWRYTTI